MEKIINLLINNWTKGVDTYTHNGSTWLIFSESKQWVIELTESKTLWYNYNFFKELFSLTSMDVVDNQHYITKWVEDNIINKVKDTRLEINITEGEVDDIIQDGVKETKISPTHTEYGDWLDGDERLDEIIKNGVKETQFNSYENKSWVEGVIKEGVKDTRYGYGTRQTEIEDSIENGVKKTGPIQHKYMVEDIIENGELKTSSRNLEQFGQGYSLWKTETVINEGVKETKEMDEWVNTPRIVGDVIENGVKETKTPGNGDIASTAEWMKENNSTSYPKMIDDVIENGIKETLNTEYMPQVMVGLL